MALDARQGRFLALLRERGGSAGNGALQDALGWADSPYQRVKEALLAAGRIERGQGRGGSVRLAPSRSRRNGADATPRLAEAGHAAEPPRTSRQGAAGGGERLA